MTIHAPPCGLARRLGAILYDAILLLAVLIFAALPVVMLYTSLQGEPPAGRAWFGFYLLAISFLYFGWFWTHGGQTLGLRTWRVVLRTEDGGTAGWTDALVRFLAAILSWLLLGGGFLWSLVDGEKRTLHDVLSRTCLLVLPRQPNRDP